MRVKSFWGTDPKGAEGVCVSELASFTQIESSAGVWGRRPFFKKVPPPEKIANYNDLTVLIISKFLDKARHES